MQNLSLTLVACAALSAPALAQFTLVGPPATATVEGNSNNVFPWGRTVAMRYQQIYDSTTFSSQTVNYPVLINNLRFRADSIAGTWPGGTWPGPINVMLSTSPVDYLAFTTTFANQQGADLTTVHSGPVTKTAGTYTAPTGPWYIDIPLSTPFLYDPNAGDLTMDVEMDPTGYTGTVTTAADAESGANALCSRLWESTSATATVASGSAANYGVVTEFGYVPANGLYASFSSNVTAGPVPTTVNFTDTTFTSAPSGVQAWAWDLDGDTTIDSTLQNPSFTYGACGAYDVTLTANDGINPASTVTRTGYIQIGISPITPSFTYAALAPSVYQFTDTSTPVPASWAWDLDGDGTTDSTLQNPVWAYVAPCVSVGVSLSVSSTCAGPWTTFQPIVTSPLSATAVPFTGGNGTSSSTFVGNMFDITVTNPKGVSICAITQGIYSYVGPFNVDIYVTEDTYINKNANAAAWRLVASGSGVSTGGPVTPANGHVASLNSPFYLPAGNYGIAIYLSQPNGTMNVSYTNGPLGPLVGTDITFFPNPAAAPGRSNTGLFTASGFTPRCWNGTFHYSTFNNGDEAGYGFFGPGCAGSMGISSLSASAPPALGSTMTVTVDNLPVNAGLMMTGFSNTSSPLGALPLDVSGFGAPGCFLRVSPDANLLILGSANTATWLLTIPVDPGLIGVLMFQQAIALDPGFNAAGAVASDAYGMMLGQ